MRCARRFIGFPRAPQSHAYISARYRRIGDWSQGICICNSAAAAAIAETWRLLHQLLTVKQDLALLSVRGQSCGGA